MEDFICLEKTGANKLVFHGGEEECSYVLEEMEWDPVHHGEMA